MKRYLIQIEGDSETLEHALRTLKQVSIPVTGTIFEERCAREQEAHPEAGGGQRLVESALAQGFDPESREFTLLPDLVDVICTGGHALLGIKVKAIRKEFPTFEFKSGWRQALFGAVISIETMRRLIVPSKAERRFTAEQAQNALRKIIEKSI